MPPSERLIFNFNSKDELKRWHLYSDSEYGGIQLIYVASKSQSLRASSFARQASPPRTDPPPPHPINKTTVNVACYEGLHHQCRPQLHPIFSPLIDSKRVATVSLSDPVIVAAKRLREFKVNSVIIVSGSQPQEILISKDVLMRVVAQNLSPELTLVEKVMTANPECATLNTTILEALHTMHDGKFLHLPVVDKAISMVEGSGAGAANDMATSMMQKFWDSALALEPPEEEYDTRSEVSGMLTSEYADTLKSVYPPLLGNSFSFKFEDQKGRVHRFNSGTESLDELVSAVIERMGIEDSSKKIQLLYVDDEGDKVLLSRDSDLAGAVSHAKLAGLKVLRLHIDEPDTKKYAAELEPSIELVQKSQTTLLTTGLVAGAAVLTGIGVFAYLRRANV